VKPAPPAAEVDVQALIAEVRDRARLRRVERALVRLQDEQLGLAAMEMRERAWVNARPPLLSHRRGYGSVISFVKRALRFTVRWLYEPIVRDQNAFNRQAADVTVQLAEAVEALLEETGALERRLARLEAGAAPPGSRDSTG
jgi:hypothetical protein